MKTRNLVVIAFAMILLVGAVSVACQGNTGTSENQNSGATQVPTGMNPGSMNGSMNPGGMNPGGMGTTGTVSGVDGNVITLATTNGSVVQVYTNSSTTIQKVVTLSLSDITAGEDITVVGSSSQSGSVNATAIIVGSTGAFQMPGSQQFPSGMNPGSMNGSTGPGGMNPGGMNPGGMNPGGMGTTGTVSEIDGNVITLATANGSVVQVYASSSTTIQEMVAASLSDIAIGESISVIGQVSQSGSINASGITIGSISVFRIPGLQP